MAITSSSSIAQGQQQVLRYSHLDDAGAPAAIVLNPGFQPGYVCVENVTDRIKYEWYEGMASSAYVKTVAAGTRTLGSDSALSVSVAAGSRPSVTLAAAEVLQNKQYRVRITA